jgi:hypothetical protein
MINTADLGEPYSEADDRRASASAALALAAFLLGLLPVPYVALGLLPVYHMHARFLVFYTPVVCLLVLGYLFYIRDNVARVLFAEVIASGVAADPEFYDAEEGVARGLGVRLRSAIFILLPILLLGVSLYCLTRYVDRFTASVATAGQVMLERLPADQTPDSAVKADAPAETRRRQVSDTVRAVSPAEIGTEAAPSVETRLAALRALPGYSQDLNPLRTYTLRQASIDDIPHFMELTTLYIGAIVPALAAVFFVLLKEYARRAMGLSDREVILRTRNEDPLVTDLPRLSSGERSRP